MAMEGKGCGSEGGKGEMNIQLDKSSGWPS